MGEPWTPGADAAAGEVGVAALPRPPALVARRHVGENAEHGVADLVSLGSHRRYSSGSWGTQSCMQICRICVKCNETYVDVDKS